MSTSLHLICVMFFGCAVGLFPQCAKILPDSASRMPVEVGKEFTAICKFNQSLYSPEDIEWIMGNVTLPRESYKTINKSTVSVTVKISSSMKNPLKCSAFKRTPSFKGPCTYGIYLDKGYPPLEPKNLTCVALQVGRMISPNLTCSWDPGTRDPLIGTKYTLFARISPSFGSLGFNSSSEEPLAHSLTVNLKTFPNHMKLAVWLKVENALGNVTLEEGEKDAEEFVKPNPPANVKVIPEDKFPGSLMVNWNHPIDATIFKLKYIIRYCEAGSSNWKEVPQEHTKAYTESFRLQSLQPYTDYVVQMRCIHHEGLGHWSDWSSNVTVRTPEESLFSQCAKILPDSASLIPVEVGKEFTAVCKFNQSLYSPKDIEWIMGNVTLPRESYKTINKSTVSVTVKISSSMKNPLKCSASKRTPSFKNPCTYGIYLDKGYPPLEPKNLTCVALQVGKMISPNLTCSWDPGTRDPLIRTKYTLFARISPSFGSLGFNSSSEEPLAHSLTVNLKTFPNHMKLAVWLKVENALGNVTLEEGEEDAEEFVKPNPPANVKVIPEDKFPGSLMVNWTHPIHATIFKLKYIIRYCEAGSSNWKEEHTKAYTESFRLQSLQPYTDYVVQMRCIHLGGLGHWSDWSSNVTVRTPEAIPRSGPDLWRVYGDDDSVIKLIWKKPVKSNGKILAYNLTIDEGNSTKRLVVCSNEHQFRLKGERALIKITANNSVGVSPPSTLMIFRPEPSRGVDQVSYSVLDGQLQVDWLPPTQIREPVSEYLLEWVSVPDKQRDWQRVSGKLNNTVLKGNFQPFKRYSISVYPIYKKKHYSWPGKNFTVEAYLQQGPPLKGPSVDVSNTQKNNAFLKWNMIPIESQRGFLTNYTIFYKTGDAEQSVVVDPHVCSYKLTGLASESQYVVHIMASNVEGSVNGSDSSFYTKKYDDGEIEVIVVLVCLGFLFFIVFIMMLSLKNREVIKKHLWPQVPDPSHSTIATWSPDCPTRTDTPKEATLPDVSVVEVDVFDGKSLCEEDKAMLPLKKDKYFSEEHSSGIGGSSCMSSPRQSVSDSDEGDSGQTTASTVQYSSVVASGYKGQTPSLQAPVFARSESTQPLLDCEEHQEHLLDGGSHQRNSYFKRGRGLEQLQPQDTEEPDCFSPMEEEDTPTLTEDPPGPVPSYMPQQSGYRPQ
ncbi:interleukin-6 receptor subunit beta isoform X2 [Colossoma macropomum]|uniref:interleukin-6 receptor subunit beta isoform X2 n=1 Tax=Colossoma macropomum TaxID=42526 RepID=UPI001864BB2C|nr:interleukin-6 receptor subunit beta isoform X2 [Colossoma macropomum]